MSKSCCICGKRAYSDYCFQHKPKKRIAQKGKRTLEYEECLDTLATGKRTIPEKVLDFTYHFCYNDYSKLENKNLQLVKNKGSLHGLLSNIISKQRFPGLIGLLENPKGLINTQIN